MEIVGRRAPCGSCCPLSGHPKEGKRGEREAAALFGFRGGKQSQADLGAQAARGEGERAKRGQYCALPGVVLFPRHEEKPAYDMRMLIK